MSFISIASEDELSEIVGVVLASEAGFDPDQLLRKNGNGYLRSNIDKFHRLAALRPVLLLTDLDKKVCPTALMEEWMPQRRAEPNLLFRVVVREIESWVLADHQAMRALLGDRANLPRTPDELVDPKQELLKLAQRASRAVRGDLVAARGAIASQGFGYNTRLRRLIESEWSPERAAMRSPSLASARARIQQAFARTMNA